jgi:hypothetical protein
VSRCMQAAYGFAMPTATRCQENAFFRTAMPTASCCHTWNAAMLVALCSECDDTSACPLNREAFN